MDMKKNEYVGKIKLYADENIRYALVLVLRSQGINIKHASEVNLLNKDDQRQFQYAKKTNRWLLISDKDFLNHNIFPFEQLKGIIIVLDSGDDFIAAQIIHWLKYELVPSGKDINNCKIELRRNSVVFHFKREGKIYTQKINIV